MIARYWRQSAGTHLQIDNGWLSGAAQYPSPNFNSRPENAEISLLVIHGISLPPGEFGSSNICDFFCNRLDLDVHPYFQQLVGLQVSAHCLIDREGAVAQFVSFDDRAWHAGISVFNGQRDCNDFSIGIELEGCDDLEYTQAQYLQLVSLTKLLQNQFPAIARQRIVGHSDIAPGRKTDPGEAFDWVFFRSLL